LKETRLASGEEGEEEEKEEEEEKKKKKKKKKMMMMMMRRRRRRRRRKKKTYLLYGFCKFSLVPQGKFLISASISQNRFLQNPLQLIGDLSSYHSRLYRLV
jgi:hypothetical protein